MCVLCQRGPAEGDLNSERVEHAFTWCDRGADKRCQLVNSFNEAQKASHTHLWSILVSAHKLKPQTQAMLWNGVAEYMTVYTNLKLQDIKHKIP